MSEGEQPDESQKTEEPTPKKLEESRKKGQVPLSRELNHWVMLLVATILIMGAADSVLANLTGVLEVYIAKAEQFPSAPGGVALALSEGVIQVLTVMAFPLTILVLAAFIGPFVQVGPLFAPETIKPSLSKISPIKGFERLFSMRSIMEFVKGILKITIVGIVGVIVLYPYIDKFENLIDKPVLLILDELQALVIRAMMAILVVLFVVAVIDITFQQSDHYKKMRMTKQEVKDEYKQSEGDPHVKARLRQLRAERARQRMMQSVPQADVVITNPTHYSIALKYDPEKMDAPLCLAKGIDEVALRIREVAKEHDIILFENPPLARALYDTVEIEETIPTEHYRAVAEVISYVFKMKGRLNQ